MRPAHTKAPSKFPFLPKEGCPERSGVVPPARKARQAAFTIRALALTLGLLAILLATGTTLWLRHQGREAAEQARAATERQVLETAHRNIATTTESDPAPAPKLRTAPRETAAPRPPEAEAAVAPPMPDAALDDVLGDSGMDYDTRRKKLAEHKDRPLPPEAHEQLEDFVRRTDPPSGIDRTEMDALKSTALHTLRRRDTGSDGATGMMKEVLADPSQGTVMREFALQHLARHHEDVSEELRPEIEQALWEAAEQSDEDEIAATALLGLEGLQEEGAFEPAETSRLAEVALERLAGEKPQAKVSALQTLAELKDPAGIEPARALLEGETRHSSTAVRLAAIYLLGQVAPDTEGERLATLAAEGDDYERKAAQAALELREL